MKLSQALQLAIKAIPDFPKQGILFRDISPILSDPGLSREIVEALTVYYSGHEIDAVAAVESRGFIFGFPLAMALKVPFIMIRKKGKLPGETVKHRYMLEYGEAEIEMQKGLIKKGKSVLLHDDLLATGGTTAAAANLILLQGGQLAGINFLIELQALNGRRNLASFDTEVHSLLTYN